jgi:hypothetical protein
VVVAAAGVEVGAVVVVIIHRGNILTALSQIKFRNKF